MKNRRIGSNGLQESYRRRVLIKGLGTAGRGIEDMDVEYLVGPEATRLSRKCRRDRDHNYRSRTQYDRDVEEGKARIRALALMEEISYEVSDDDSRDRIIDAVTKECKTLGYTISCREAALRRTVEAASAITMGAMASRRKWMIDSGCAMDLVSKKELAPEEMELAERVRKISSTRRTGVPHPRPPSTLISRRCPNAPW